MPLLLHALPPLYLHHFALLISSIHILLQERLTEIQIQAAEQMLIQFYNLLPELYGNESCTLNSHLLIHLPKYVRLWGPLWTHSAFGFESLNRHITGMIHSKYKIGGQLLFSIEVANTLALLAEKSEDIESDGTLQFLDMKLNHHRKNMSQIVEGTYSIGPLQSSVTEDEHVLVRQYFSENIIVSFFFRLYHKGTLYYSANYGKEGGKRNSSVCCYQDSAVQKVGIIKKFVVSSNSICLALITPFEISSSLLKTLGNPGRDMLHTYSDLNFLSVFIFRVKKGVLPLV